MMVHVHNKHHKLEAQSIKLHETGGGSYECSQRDAALMATLKA
jgi:hypothetical protein